MPVTKYVWDPLSDNVLMETDESDVTQAVYTNEPYEFGETVSQNRNGTASYYHSDGQGSVRDVTDNSEIRTDTYIYSGFGETVAKTGTTTNPFRYVGLKGYYFDEETGEYYVRARMYMPKLARFTARDPLPQEEPVLLGRVLEYTYADNNPVNMVDPSGLFAFFKPPVGRRTCKYECPFIRIKARPRFWLWGCLPAFLKADCIHKCTLKEDRCLGKCSKFPFWIKKVAIPGPLGTLLCPPITWTVLLDCQGKRL